MLIEKGNQMQLEQQVDELIAHLKNSNNELAHGLLQSLTSHQQIQKYFQDLHLYVTCQNLCTFRKYETINDGLYILLKGQIHYTSNQKLPKRQNFKKSKSYAIKDSYSILFTQPLTVFNCQSKNCTVYEESYLLKITSEETAFSHFQKKMLRRRQLYQKHYLSQDHYKYFSIQDCKQVLNVDLNFHSIFHFATYSFRHVIKLASPAIVSSGRAKLKVPEFNSHQFDEYGVLLPNLSYEVTTSQLSIMVINNHESLAYGFNLNLLKDSKISQRPKLSNNPSIHKKNSPLLMCVYQQQPQMMQNNRKKEFAKHSKQIEKYGIFPNFICTQKLKSIDNSQIKLSKSFRKRINFNKSSSNELHPNGQLMSSSATQNRSRNIKPKPSQTNYQASSSLNSPKFQFYGKNKMSMTESHILAKIRDKITNMRQLSKNQNMFPFTVSQDIFYSKQNGCISEL